MANFIDVTEKWINGLQLGCKKHAYVANFMQVYKGVSGLNIKRCPKCDAALDASQAKKYPATAKSRRANTPIFKTNIPKWAAAIDDDITLAERILCAEDPEEAGSKSQWKSAATLAFVPLMGKTYFPPQIKKLDNHNMQVSCGEDELSLDIYGWDALGYHNAKSPEGKDVSGTFDMLKMDGGYTEQKPTDGQWFGYPVSKDKSYKITPKQEELDWINKEASKLWIRRRADGSIPSYPNMNAWGCGGGSVQSDGKCTNNIIEPAAKKHCESGKGMTNEISGMKPWEDPPGKDLPCPNQRSGNYRPNLSSKTNTCCPTKGLPDNQIWYNRDFGVYQSVPKPTDWRVTSEQMSAPCYRGLYGVTKACKANLHIQILECKGCECLNAKKQRQLVHIVTEHALSSGTAGCKPWFTLADSGVRAFVNTVRKQVVDNKLCQCGFGVKGKTCKK